MCPPSSCDVHPRHSAGLLGLPVAKQALERLKADTSSTVAQLRQRGWGRCMLLCATSGLMPKGGRRGPSAGIRHSTPAGRYGSCVDERRFSFVAITSAKPILGVPAGSFGGALKQDSSRSLGASSA